MKFLAMTVLCTAPLALGGSLEAELAPRGAELKFGMSGLEMARDNVLSSKREDRKYSKDPVYGDNKLTQSTTVDEVIIIWVNQGGGAQTSTVTDVVTVTASGSNAAVAAATHSVTVGGAAGLVYVPDTIEAAVGDMVIFTFESQNHTVTQSAFTTPCEALVGGKDSGFMANINNTVSPAPKMAMQVTVATPIWFYCKQKGHCGKGMTFSINPTANKTQAMFQQMAIAQNGTGAAAPISYGSTTVSVAAAVTATSVSSAAAASATGLTQGIGTLNSEGSCACSCLCGAAAFPNAAVQGIGAFGGMPGSMPMSALEA